MVLGQGYGGWGGAGLGRAEARSCAMLPPQERRKEARQQGLDCGPCPFSVSVAGYPSILSVPAVCHPPFGEAAAEDGLFGALAGDIVHPNPPCACGDKSTRFLSRRAGEQDRRQTEHCCVCSWPGCPGLCWPLTPPRPNTQLLEARTTMTVVMAVFIGTSYVSDVSRV